MFIILTFLGFLSMQLGDVLLRNKQSKSTPKNASWNFFWKDNKLKIGFSLLLSFTLSTSIYLISKGNLESITFITDGLIGNAIYWAIGVAPEFYLQKAKKKFGLFQPDNIEIKGNIYRKENN